MKDYTGMGPALRQEDLKFEARLDYLVSSCLKKNPQNESKMVQWLRPLFPSLDT